MQVKLKKRLYGVKDGEIYPKWHEAGTIVEGDLAQAAVDQGVAADIAKKRTPPEAEHKKQSSASQRGRASRKKTAT